MDHTFCDFILSDDFTLYSQICSFESGFPEFEYFYITNSDRSQQIRFFYGRQLLNTTSLKNNLVEVKAITVQTGLSRKVGSFKYYVNYLKNETFNGFVENIHDAFATPYPNSYKLRCFNLAYRLFKKTTINEKSRTVKFHPIRNRTILREKFKSVPLVFK